MGFDQIIIKIVESSVSAGILILVLYIFLPRLIKSLDSHTEQQTKEHMAQAIILVHLEKRLNWHEARVYGVNPATGETDNDRYQAAYESFQRANANTDRLIDEIKRVFGVNN